MSVIRAFDAVRIHNDAAEGQAKPLGAYLDELTPGAGPDDGDEDDAFFRMLDRAIARQERERQEAER